MNSYLLMVHYFYAKLNSNNYKFVLKPHIQKLDGIEPASVGYFLN